MYSYIIAVSYTMNFDLTEEMKKQLDYMIAQRRCPHRHPCVSFHDEATRDYLAAAIAALGPDTLGLAERTVWWPTCAAISADGPSPY